MNQLVLDILEKLEKLKQRGGNEYWNIEWDTGKFLSQLVTIHKPMVILEIGTSTGFSGLWLAGTADEYGGRLITIESSKKRLPLAKDSFGLSKLENIELIFAHAPECFEQFDESLIVDMMFIDASKRDYIKFYNKMKPFLSDGAVIIADNVISHSEFVGDYLDLVRKENDSVLLDIDQGLEFTIYKKTTN